MKERARNLLIVASLLAGGIWSALGMPVGSDLARFMPVPEDADERLLVDEISRGPGSRILLLAIASESPDRAALLSRELRRRLHASGAFDRTWNGEFDLDAELERLLPLRFTHSPAMDTARFDREALVDVLRQRLADLGGAGGAAFEKLLEHDPQLLTVAMLEAWAPRRQPIERDGVWFSRRSEALLMVETRETGFDPAAQSAAVALIEREFAALQGPAGERLVISGPGSFSARMNTRVGGEAQRLGGIAVVGLILLLVFAYRSLAYVLASVLPLACAAASGLIALRFGFEEAHGITLAFAFTLIGVAQDYPVHLMSHARPGVAARIVARQLWPTLRLGVCSTVLAYLTLFSARTGGLAQLAVFTIAGLLTAAIVTRFVLPALMPDATRDVLESRGFEALARRLRSMRAGGWVALPAFALLSVALTVGHERPWWSNDLSALTPLPREWLAEDSRLRDELIAPDVRHVLVLSGMDVDDVLRLSERLSPRFDALRAAHAIADDGLPSRHSPSAERQHLRVASLPAPESLRKALKAAADEVGFESSYFEPMIADVAAARAADANRTSARSPGESIVDDRLRAILRVEDGRALAMVVLSGLSNPEAVRLAIKDEPRARLWDLKAAAERLVIAFRERVVIGLLWAATALITLMAFALGWRRAPRVLLPVALGLAVTVGTLRLLGIELTLFHLIALMLAAGLGIDYALFFHHSGPGADEARTLHAVLVSAASTLLAFGLLAASSIPVLNAIGLTVAIGVAAQFVFSLLLARDAQEAGAAV